MVDRTATAPGPSSFGAGELFLVQKALYLRLSASVVSGLTIPWPLADVKLADAC